MAEEYYALMGTNKGIIDWYSFVQKIYDEGECRYKEMVNGKLPFVLIEKKELEKVKGVVGSNLYEVLNDKNHKCDTCGCRSNYFSQDYRVSSEMTSKYWSCEYCISLDTRSYLELLRDNSKLLSFI